MRFWHYSVGAALLLCTLAPAQALPIYARKEGKQCAYCHINPAGGGRRNYRGIYYGTHNHSFAGFVDQGPNAPLLKLAWQQALPDHPSRVAVADGGEAGKTRLVIVNSGKDADSRSVSFQSWDKDGQKLLQDTVVDTTKDADRMEVGHFGTDKSTVVVLPTGYISVVGGDPKKVTVKVLPGAEQMIGAVRLKDGSETFVTFDGDQGASHQVDLTAKEDGWLAPGPSVASDDGKPAAFLWGETRGASTPDIAQKLGVPGDTANLTLFGVWDPMQTGQWYYYVPQHIADGDQKGDYLAVYAAGKGATPTWTSAKLAGKILDIAEGPDIHGGKQPGLYVLADGSADGVGRTLYFFSLS